MATIPRNTGFSHYTQGTLRTVAQLKAFLIDAQANLATEDDGAMPEAMELIITEVQPLMYYSAANAQTITVVVDGHAVDAATLQARIRGKGASAGPNGFDLSGATVVEATALVAT